MAEVQQSRRRRCQTTTVWELRSAPACVLLRRGKECGLRIHRTELTTKQPGNKDFFAASSPSWLSKAIAPKLLGPERVGVSSSLTVY